MGRKRYIRLLWSSSTLFLRMRRREPISTRRIVRSGLPERWLLGGRHLSFIPGCQGQPAEVLLRLATQENFPIIISMDEVHVLFIVRHQDTWPHTLYSRLKSVVGELTFVYSFSPLWQIPCAKDLKIVFYHPHLQSFRLTFTSSRNLLLLGSFPDFCWFIRIYCEVRTPTVCVSRVAWFRFSHVASRFYATYVTRLAGNKEPPKKSILDITRVARMKLSGGDELHSPVLDASSLLFFQLDFFLISLALLPWPDDMKNNKFALIYEYYTPYVKIGRQL